MIRELEDYGIVVDVHDPWVDPAEATREYGIRPLPRPEEGVYDGVLLAVAHRQFHELGAEGIRRFGVPGRHTLYDLKHVLGADDADLRL